MSDWMPGPYGAETRGAMPRAAMPADPGPASCGGETTNRLQSPQNPLNEVRFAVRAHFSAGELDNSEQIKYF